MEINKIHPGPSGKDDLSPLSVQELLTFKEAPCSIYGLNNKEYNVLIKKNEPLKTELLKNLIRQGHLSFFVLSKEKSSVIKHNQKMLLETSRALSSGASLKKSLACFNFLAINMGHLHADPQNDDLLTSEYQSAKNLAPFLMNNLSLHGEIYQNFINQRHPFILSATIISSLFVVGIAKTSCQFSDKDIEHLFVTSILKDIGMSCLPLEKYNSENLSKEDQALFSRHAKHSVETIKGRVPLKEQHLNIIQHHHILGLSPLRKSNTATQGLIIGFETFLIGITDIIGGIIVERPFRKGIPLAESLSIIKNLIADKYPQEFKIVVSYFKKFFLKK